MMKPILCYRHTDGLWWCRRIGVYGCGKTPREAWDDMWALYREAVTPKYYAFGPSRAG